MLALSPALSYCSPRLTSEPGTSESSYRYHTTGQFPLMYLILDRFIHMQNKQTNPQKLRIFKNVITVFFFLRVVIFSMASSILRKKLLWPWIFHSGSSRSLWGPTYDTSFLFTLLPVQPSRSLFLQSVEDAKEKGGRKGGRGGKKGQRKFPPGFFSCLRFLKFYGPDCLGAWFSRVCTCPRKGGMSAKEFNE